VALVEANLYSSIGYKHRQQDEIKDAA